MRLLIALLITVSIVVMIWGWWFLWTRFGWQTPVAVTAIAGGPAFADIKARR